MKPTSPVAIKGVGEPAVPRRLNSAYHHLPVLQRYRVNDRTGCWDWQGARMGGYGRCKVGNLTVQAHRVFYEHHVATIPSGHDIHHRCGNRGCVNPDHLEPLTRAENTRRKPHGHTRLTWDDANEIRTIIDDLCVKYNVRPRTLAAIGERRIWNPTEGGDA